MKYIPLTKGKQAIVDDEWFPILYLFNWHYQEESKGGYARKMITIDGKQKPLWMHRLIANCPQGMFVDHINHNKLDNRRENLRLVTVRENGMNREVSKTNKSGIKGVSYFRKRWRAIIGRKLIGYFDTKEEAAKAYNKAAKNLFGDYAKLNKV